MPMVPDSPRPTGSESGPPTSRPAPVPFSTFFPGFREVVQRFDGVDVPAVVGGQGPPLLLLHGHPQTRAIWHRVTPSLARRFTVVAADLRGYGDAGKPPGGPGHLAYAKREMARDPLRLMQALGFPRFALMGHDRGARVAHRLAMDHPDAVERLVLLDVCPTLAMYEQTTMAFAQAYWHWFFLIQPAPMPEAAIAADPRGWLERLMGGRSAGLAPFTPEAFSEYVRAISDPACAHAICEDYRAAATVDLDHERADRAAGRRLACPVRVLWGRDGTVGRQFDPLAEWRRLADRVDGGPLPCGHYIPEEAPEALLAALDGFL